jgi:hypothetical protein
MCILVGALGQKQALTCRGSRWELYFKSIADIISAHFKSEALCGDWRLGGGEVRCAITVATGMSSAISRFGRPNRFRGRWRIDRNADIGAQMRFSCADYQNFIIYAENRFER